MSGFFDREGNGRCVAGEHVRPAMQLRRADGALADLSGTWCYRIFVPGAVAALVERVVPVEAGTRVTFDLPASATGPLKGLTGLAHAISRLTPSGFRDVVSGRFTARAGGPAKSGSGAPGEDVLTVDEAAVLTVEAVGPPGVSAVEQAYRLGLIDAPDADLWAAWVRQPAVEAAATLTAQIAAAIGGLPAVRAGGGDDPSVVRTLGTPDHGVDIAVTALGAVAYTLAKTATAHTSIIGVLSGPGPLVFATEAGAPALVHPLGHDRVTKTGATWSARVIRNVDGQSAVWTVGGFTAPPP